MEVLYNSEKHRRQLCTVTLNSPPPMVETGRDQGSSVVVDYTFTGETLGINLGGNIGNDYFAFASFTFDLMNDFDLSQIDLKLDFGDVALFRNSTLDTSFQDFGLDTDFTFEEDGWIIGLDLKVEDNYKGSGRDNVTVGATVKRGF